MNLHVIMESVSQIASGVMVMMTVETTVMKMDVVQVFICIVYGWVSDVLTFNT